MNDRRQASKKGSNNKENPNKNICSLAVAKACHVDHFVRYLHWMDDLKRALRNYYSVRSIMWCVNQGKCNKTVGGARAALSKQLKKDSTLLGIVINTPGHVLLMGKDGSTIVDTDPRDRDRRPIRTIYGLYKKRGVIYRTVRGEKRGWA